MKGRCESEEEREVMCERDVEVKGEWESVRVEMSDVGR